MYKRINGLQHIGLAITDMERTLDFCQTIFGMDIPFFDSVQPAPLMDVYTRNSTITKRASMIINLQGGCAMEVLRPVSFEPVKAKFPIRQGELGIFMVQMKCKDVHRSHEFCSKHQVPQLTKIHKDPNGNDTFYLTDPDGNQFQYVKGAQWYTDNGHHSGGVVGCSIGVKDMDKAMVLYRQYLGYDEVVYDQSGVFADWSELPSGKENYRRVLLTQSTQPGGGFAKVMGKTYIELVQALDSPRNYIFEDRIWCDTGFAHVGFDVKGMKEIEKDLSAAGYPFTCDSNSALSMGTTKVHCVYIDDLDKTPIELIEVYKVPILEKWGVFLNVEKRDPLKPLPDFMLKALRFSRKKAKA